MRILVTGGAGFIGSHLCERLLNEGNEVICLDNYFTGTKENIKHLMDSYKFEVIRHDVVNPIHLEVDQIYHLACPASPIHYQHNPIKTTKVSFLGTLNMLGLAKRIGAKILLSSTSEVYGDPLEHPQTESYWGNVNCIGDRSCYDEGKRVAETLMMDFHKQHNIDIKIVRIFNTYGPNMALNDGRVISNFIIQALSGKPITIYGDGTHTRSFQYIDDLIEGVIRMMNTKNFIGPVNLGNPKEYYINDIAGLIVHMTGRSIKDIVYEKLPNDDPKRRQPDITLANNKLNWKPEISLAVGLERTIKYFKGEIK